jgi:hypothetical protein
MTWAVTRSGAIMLLVTLALASGCVSMTITADGTTVPVSASSYVFDEQQRAIGPADLEVVRVFRLYRDRFKIFWSLIPLESGAWDLSDELNQISAQAHGDAIVDLTVDAQSCASNATFIFNILPLWPSCGTFIVSGKVVRRRGHREMAR